MAPTNMTKSFLKDFPSLLFLTCNFVCWLLRSVSLSQELHLAWFRGSLGEIGINTFIFNILHVLEHEGGVSEREEISWMGGETCIKPQLKKWDLLLVPINSQGAGKAGLIHVTFGENQLISRDFSCSQSLILSASPVKLRQAQLHPLLKIHW